MIQVKSVDELERDVEQARARVAADIAMIRAPETFEAAKSSLIGSVFGYRDEITDNVRGSVTSYSDSLVDSLKAKAAANPLAVAAIGVGVAWRLYKHPPVMTVLVGLGLTSLLRTDPDDDSMHPRKLMELATEKAMAFKDHAVAQVQDMSAAAEGVLDEKLHQAAYAAEGAYETVKEGAIALTDRAREGAESALASLTPASTQRSHISPLNVPAPGVPARSFASQTFGGERRDAYLLAFAALAVGAAISLSRRTGADEHEHEDALDEGETKWRRH
jgi:hypothetical protein